MESATAMRKLDSIAFSHWASLVWKQTNSIKRETKQIEKLAMEQVMIPTVRAMEKEGRLFKGVLYAGLMIHDGAVKVLLQP